MRILITTGLYPPEIGGPATYTKLIEEELVRQGQSVFVLPFRSVRHLPSLVRHVVFLWKVIAQGRSVDVIYTQDTVSVGFPTALASWFLGKRFFVRVPGDFAWEQGVQRFGVKEGIDDFQKKHYGFRVELLRKIQSFVCNRAEKVITPSLYFKNLVSGWVKNKGKIQHIYNGITFEEVEAFPFKKKTLVASGRLVPWKGFDSLIKFVAKTDFDLVILGDGEDKDRLSGLIESYGAHDRIKLLGRVSRSELLSYSKGAYAVILPSTFESFSFQLVEAMSVGALCIAFNIGNLDEIITNGVSGYLVPEGDYQAIEKILSHLPEVSSLISKNAIEESKRFSIEKTGKALVNAFKKEKRVLMISTDRNIFDETSSVSQRIEGYGRLFDTLDIIVFTKRGFKKQVRGNISLIPTNSYSRWMYVFDALQKVSELPRPSVITTQDPFETGIVGFIVSFWTRWNVQIHTDWKSPLFSKSILNRIRFGLATLIMRRASSIRVVSQRIQKSLPKYCKNKKVTVLPIAIHGEYSQNSILGKDHYTLLSISRLEEEKNIDVLIQGMKHINNATLHIVGGGSLELKLKGLVQELGLEESVVFEGPTKNVSEWYQKADVYVQASSYEGFGLTLLEAGLHGLPIVTTDVGLIGYEIPREAIVLFDGSVESFASHLKDILANKEERERLADEILRVSSKLLVSPEDYNEAYRESL